MEGFLSTFSPYNGNPVCAPLVQDSGWAKRQGRFVTPPGLNYLELCKAIIAQVNPALPPALRKAHTKECGVQVNAKVNKVVQCSLGPKTLFCQEGDHQHHQASPTTPKRSPDVFGAEGKALCATPAPPPLLNNLRFLRPVSIYSPMFDRRPLKLRDDGGHDEGEAGVPEQAACEEGAETDQFVEDGDGDLKTAFHRSLRGSNFQVRTGPV